LVRIIILMIEYGVIVSGFVRVLVGEFVWIIVRAKAESNT